MSINKSRLWKSPFPVGKYQSHDGKRGFPVWKSGFRDGKRGFPVEKSRFPAWKRGFRGWTTPFRVGKGEVEEGKGDSPSRKADFGTGKEDFPTGKGDFAAGKGDFQARLWYFPAQHTTREARLGDVSCVVLDVGRGQVLVPIRLWNLVTGLGDFQDVKGVFGWGIAEFFNRRLFVCKLQ